MKTMVQLFSVADLLPQELADFSPSAFCRIEDAGPCYCNTALSITKTEIHRSAFPFRLNGHEYPQTLQGVDRQFMAIYFVTFFIMLGADVFGEYLASVFAGSPEPPAQMTDIDASEKRETTFSTLFLINKRCILCGNRHTIMRQPPHDNAAFATRLRGVCHTVV